ncbi:MAG TPA: Calx-beta domain-containing protein, partial [Pirellulales bacterium]
SSAPTSSVSVQYATIGDTATPGVDFTAASGTLTFAAGETSKVVSVTVLADLLDEANETLRLVLSNAVGLTIADGTGVGTIVDDDDAAPPPPPPPPPTPSLTVADVSIVEGNSGVKNAVFTVTLSAASASTVTVNYATSAGTATSGTDFTAASGVLSFAPGVTSLTVSVPVLGDAIDELDETFFLNLAGATNATIARARGTATIPDDDVSAPTPTAVAFDVADDWGSGFVAGMTIQNGGATAISGWTLEFTFDREITGIWGAEIVSRVGNRYVVRNLSWNAQIAPGGSVNFGFQGVTGNIVAGPTDIVLNGQPISSGVSSLDLALAGF